MSSEDSDLAALLDVLIPGNARWPSFSAAVPAGPFLAGLDELQRAALSDLIAIDEGDRTASLATWERTAPEAFAALLKAVHRAYYTAPIVVAIVHRLAEDSPREPLERFDTSLVAKVLATGAGKRRL